MCFLLFVTENFNFISTFYIRATTTTSPQNSFPESVTRKWRPRITAVEYSPDGREMLVSYSSDHVYVFDPYQAPVCLILPHVCLKEIPGNPLSKIAAKNSKLRQTDVTQGRPHPCHAPLRGSPGQSAQGGRRRRQRRREAGRGKAREVTAAHEATEVRPLHFAGSV